MPEARSESTGRFRFDVLTAQARIQRQVGPFRLERACAKFLH